MKIEAKAGPAIPLVDKPGGQSNLAKENRARAIEAFNKSSQAAQNTLQPGTPVQNASNVSPEEMVGVKASINASTPDPIVENHTSEEIQEVTSPQKVEEPISQHYATLARKEKALRAETQKLNAARSAFKAEQEALKSVSATPPQSPSIDESKYIPRDRLSQDPISVLEELGYSSEDIAQKLLNRPQTDPATAAYLAKLEEKLSKLEAAQDETKKTFQTSQQAAYQEAITALKYEAQDLVENDPEFATIKETGQADEVVKLIEEVHSKGLPGKYRKGTLLSVDQAARLVEDELVNQWVEQHEKLSRLDKIKKRLQPATPAAKQSSASQGTQSQNSTQNTTKTLTNNMGSASKLSARERAIAVFNGNK